uniref:Uncharacterized protein n=1 Tax=Chlamydomonas euryale TaxID=1486919 RepID=A0A7R9YTY1_9CHLO
MAGTRRASTLCRVSGRRESVNLFGMFGGGGGDDEEYYDEEFTVMKLHVGVFGDVPMWQKRLDNAATKFDTNNPDELHQIYKDALMLVLRNMSYVGYASSAGKVFDNLEDAEKKFNSVLLEERLKFEEETLVSVDGRKKESALSSRKADDVGLDRWLCMSMLMCLEGRVKLPKVTSQLELKKVLTELGGMTAEDVIAFELLWTPQASDDSYSKDELLTDYPDMVTLT